MKKHLNLHVVLYSFIAAIVFCYGTYYVPINYLHDILALLLASFASFYIGIAISKKKAGPIVMESIIFVFIFLAAIFGLYYFLPILGAGFLSFAIWNIVRFFFNVGVETSKSISLGLCVINTVFAIYILLLLL
jgi:hypothetical protein